MPLWHLNVKLKRNSGGVGQATCQLGKAYGLRVFGTASTDEGRNWAMKSGAQFVFNHSENGYIEKMLEEQPNGWLIHGLK